MSVSYVVSPEAPAPRTFLAVRSDAGLYDDEQGCHLSFQYDVDLSRDADWAASFPDLADVEVTELDMIDLGDEAYWLRVTGISEDEPAMLMTIDQIVVRVGRARAFIRADAQFPPETPSDVGQNQVLAWAQFVAMRMESALAA
jgi:hypothetical protein